MQRRDRDNDDADPNALNNPEAMLRYTPDFILKIAGMIVLPAYELYDYLNHYFTGNHNAVADFEPPITDEPEEIPIAQASTNPLQEKLEAAGFTSEMIKNHPKLNFFFDPVKHEIINKLAVTNTEEIVDADSAINLKARKLRVARQSGVTDFFKAPALNPLIELLVNEAIEDLKKSQPAISKNSSTC